MSRIVTLPNEVVSQIAAGEVIERPGSAVKELLENAVDADARAVTVELLEGGREFIRVVDDGIGMLAEDLPLAVTSHATSKLRAAEDLFHVRSLGFRGEALNSIGGVSNLLVQSRPAQQPRGAQIEVCHGVAGPVRECACPLGTQIEVRNLFASVPVRRKFLKSKQTELGHISEAMTRIALARPGIALRLVHNERVVQQRPADFDRHATIDALFGGDVAEALLPIDIERDGMRVSGFAADPRINRPNLRGQYLFVNGRFVRDRSLGHAIAEAYRGLLMTGRYSMVFLFFELPRDQVDVNVHPTKIEVRFLEPHRAYSLLLSALRTRFLTSDLTAKLHSVAEQHTPAAPARSESEPVAAAAMDNRSDINREFGLRQETTGPEQPSLWADDRQPWPPATSATVSRSAAPSPVESATVLDGAPARTQTQTMPGNVREEDHPTARFISAAEQVTGAQISDPGRDSEHRTERVRGFQLHHSYLVVETEEGMLLVDQHALHERILYEHLRKRVQAGGVEVQQFLVPEPVELSAVQTGIVLDHRAALAQAGIGVDEFGQRCVLVQSMPVLLAKQSPQAVLGQLATELEESGRLPSQEQLIDELLHMIACKAAVKAGDPLTQEEISDLVGQRHLVDDAHHCPHGRPTVLQFTLRELEKQFKRT